MNYYNKKSKIYVLSDKKLIQKLRNTILKKHKHLKEFARVNKIKHKTLYSWFEKGSRIPLSFIINLYGNNFYQYLDGYFLVSGTSNYKLKIYKKIGIIEAILLGWVLSEGHLENDKCTISQNNKKVLLKLKSLCERYYGKCGAHVYPDKCSFKLVLPRVFVIYFNDRFGIPLGKKSYLIKIPQQIMNGTSEIKHAFLSAYIEGDGSFSPYKTKHFKRPRITICTYSALLSRDCKKLFSSLGYKNKTYKSRNEYKISLLRSDDISKFYFHAFNYLIDSDKKNKFESYLSHPHTLKTIFVDGKKLTHKFRNDIGSWKEVALILRNLGHRASFFTIKNWCLGYFKPNLKIALLMCDYLKEDYFKHIPKQYGGLLYLHNKISYSQLLKLKDMESGQEEFLTKQQIIKRLT
ncbi:MAG: hypothetical protein KAT77_01230 [Nanoarchaeota archaeon]|nr:hypothetical protein [Nanoarchaeota archaeon]